MAEMIFGYSDTLSGSEARTEAPDQDIAGRSLTPRTSRIVPTSIGYCAMGLNAFNVAA